MKEEILRLIDQHDELAIEWIAATLGMDVPSIQKAIDEMKQEGILLGVQTIINWEKSERPLVSALIEVRVHPQKHIGFDRFASKIASYDQVTDCYLMSGGYDLGVVVRGKDFKEVALFVAEKLAVIDGVLSTSTHFHLKTYKKDGVFFDGTKKDDREAIVL